MNYIKYNNRAFFNINTFIQIIFISCMLGFLPLKSVSANYNDISGYIIANVTSLESEDGNPVLRTRHVRYPVIYADFGYRCEFFLKNQRQDITRASTPSERVYFKDVKKIQAFKGVPVKSDSFGLNISTGSKHYVIRKWNGIAALKAGIKADDCNVVGNDVLTYDWPTFHFKIINGSKQVVWFETDLLSIVEFAYDANKGKQIYRLLKPEPKKVTQEKKEEKTVEKLKEEAIEYSNQLAEEKTADTSDEDFERDMKIYRKRIKEGDDSHCGLVIEVKNKVVKVQTKMGVHWLKRDQLYPPGIKPCDFLNGVYQVP